MDVLTVLEFVGSATGILGALTMAIRPQTHAHWAWSLWLISSTTLFVMAFEKAMWSLAAMQVVFTIINVLGLRNSLRIRSANIEL